jgi:hypothetical protein
VDLEALRRRRSRAASYCDQLQAELDKHGGHKADHAARQVDALDRIIESASLPATRVMGARS